MSNKSDVNKWRWWS